MATFESEDVFVISRHLFLMENSFFKEDIEKKGQKNVTWEIQLGAQ